MTKKTEYFLGSLMTSRTADYLDSTLRSAINKRDNFLTLNTKLIDEIDRETLDYKMVFNPDGTLYVFAIITLTYFTTA